MMKMAQEVLSKGANDKNSLPNWVDEETKRGTELVMMGGNKEIILDNNGKRIATFGLLGCTAVCVLAKNDDGWVGYIQHYPQHGDSVRALKRFSGHIDGIIQVVAIMSPGEWVKDEQSGKWVMVFNDNKLTDELTSCVGQNGGGVTSYY